MTNDASEIPADVQQEIKAQAEALYSVCFGVEHLESALTKAYRLGLAHAHERAPDFIGPCGTCGKFDALSRDAENHVFCWRCDRYERAQAEIKQLRTEVLAARGGENLALAWMRHAEKGEQLADEYSEKLRERLEAAEAEIERLTAEVNRMVDARMVLGNDLQGKWQAAEARVRALEQALLWIESYYDGAMREVGCPCDGATKCPMHAALTLEQERAAPPSAAGSEQIAFERLSKALTGGNASTWDELFHAAESRAEPSPGSREPSADSVVLTPEEWDAARTCRKCGAVADDPCSAVMHEDDCEPSPEAIREAPASLDKYNELLYAVECSRPGETRHETALRYIRQAQADSGEARK